MRKVAIVGLVLAMTGLAHGAWDPDKPADTQSVDLRDDDIRANFSALDTLFGISSGGGDANLVSCINVKAMGAAGDGTTDDTAAIQAAENKADDDNTALFFPPGRYVITSTVTFSSGVSVYGSGAKIIESPIFADPMFEWASATDFTISGLSFEGGQTQALFVGAAGEDRAAILLDTCSKFSIHDVNVTNKTIGIALDTCTKGSISESRFVGFCDPESYADGTGYNYAKAVYVGHNSGTCSEIVVSGCDFEHWGDAVGGSASSSRCIVMGCTIDGICDNAIYVSSGNDWLAQGNYIRNSLGYGIKMRGSGHRAIGNRIYNSGSTTLEIGGGGINMTSLSTTQYDTGVAVIGNLIQTTTSNGIAINRAADTNPGIKGIIVADNDCNDCLVSTVADNYGAGIQIGIGMHDFTVTGNTIRNTGESALHGALALIGSAALDCNDGVVSNNLFDTCTGGIYAQYTAGITCTNNRFREITDQAIRLYQDCDNWTLALNDGNNVDAVGTVFIYADTGELTNSKVIGNSAVGGFTTITNSACDTGSGNWIFGNDSADAVTLAGDVTVSSDLLCATDTQYATKTVVKTIDLDDDASTDDYQFDDDAVNTTEQVITLTGILPAYAELVSCQLRCFETVTGSAAMSIDVGTTTGEDQILAAANTDTANDINTTGAAAGPELAATNAARSVYVNATPGANWSTLNAGRWAIMLTYIDYGAVYTQKSP